MPRPADKTPWFKGSTTPVRPGVYERKYRRGVFFCEWTGHQWLGGSLTVTDALRSVKISDSQNRPWRGLIKGSMPNA